MNVRPVLAVYFKANEALPHGVWSLNYLGSWDTKITSTEEFNEL